MKTLIILCSFLIALNGNCQKHEIFYNKPGVELRLNDDSSFVFSYFWDVSFWAVGQYVIKKDTLYFHFEKVYDTIVFYDNEKRITETKIIISCNGSRNINIYPNEVYDLDCKNQNDDFFPDRLLKKGKKLKYIDKQKPPPVTLYHVYKSKCKWSYFKDIRH